MKRTRYRLGVLAALVLAGCGEPSVPPERSAASGEEVLAVYTVNYPLAWLAGQIGADTVAVSFPAPPDIDPAFWSPDAETVAAYQRADLVLLNGAGYARWVQRAALRRSRLVDTAAGFRARWVPIDAGVTHGHGPQGEHTHGDFASTTWIDPTLATEQARAIADALARARPVSEPAIRARFEVVASDLADLDARFSAAVKRLGDAPILFSHPVYQYLIARYGLRARSLHWEPGEEPGESEWAALDGLLAEHPARVLLWEAAPAPRTQARLAALGVMSLIFDPCANVPDEGDFLSVSNANAKALENAAKWATVQSSRALAQ